VNVQITERYAIRSEADNFVITEYTLSNKGKHAGEMVPHNRGYFSTLKSAFIRLKDLLLLDSTCSTLPDLLATLQEITDLLDKKAGECNG
jgi:hypothetical protein